MRAFDFRETCIKSETEIFSIKESEAIDEDDEEEEEEVITEEVDEPKEFFACPICQSIFTSSQDLTLHVIHSHQTTEEKAEAKKSSSSGKKFECHVCCKKFESPWKVKRHLLVHKDVLAPSELPKFPPREYKHECPECGKRVETPSKLLRHMAVHDKKTRLSNGVNQHRPLACSECPQR